jgi:hypothetical protein
MRYSVALLKALSDYRRLHRELIRIHQMGDAPQTRQRFDEPFAALDLWGVLT